MGIADEKKGITVKIDATLHAEIREYLERHEGMTMAEFITLAVDDELHPKIQQKEGSNMGNMRTLAFQVPEDLFQRIKDYLHRNNISQKDFVIGLIEDELSREQAERENISEDEQPYVKDENEILSEYETTETFEPDDISGDTGISDADIDEDEFEAEDESEEDGEDESEDEAAGFSMRM